MDRRKFIQKSALGSLALGLGLGPQLLANESSGNQQ